MSALRSNGHKPAALVIGAGIAGIQSALDIADAGFQVYLVERSSSIGGRMSQLDNLPPWIARPAFSPPRWQISLATRTSAC
jgi:heterodisulfide reductase subunit A